MTKIKRKHIILILLINILMCVIFFGSMYHTVLAHEDAHKAIAENYGCVDSEIKINMLELTGTFECLEYMPGIDHTDELVLHSLNEIVSYNMFETNSILIFGFILIINVMFIILMMIADGFFGV